MNITVNRSIPLCQAANVPSLCSSHPCLTGGYTLTTTTKLKEEKPTGKSTENTQMLQSCFPCCCSSYHWLLICYLPGTGTDEEEHATTLHSCHSVFNDRFIFRTNFLGMRLPWECHDQSQEINLTSLRHWTGTAFLSQKKRYTKNLQNCRDIDLAWELHAPTHRLLPGGRSV